MYSQEVIHHHYMFIEILKIFAQDIAVVEIEEKLPYALLIL